MSIKETRNILVTVSVWFFIIGAFASVLIVAMFNQASMQMERSAAAKAHSLAIAMFAYANDNNQVCPSGATSTDIFNKLYAAGYLHDPTDVYLPGTGKVPYTGGLPIKLTSRNVSYSIVERSEGGVLSGISGEDDSDLPLILSCDMAPNAFANVLNFFSSKPKEGLVIVTLGQQARFVRGADYSLPANLNAHGHKYVIVGP